MKVPEYMHPRLASCSYTTLQLHTAAVTTNENKDEGDRKEPCGCLVPGGRTHVTYLNTRISPHWYKSEKLTQCGPKDEVPKGQDITVQFIVLGPENFFK